MKTLRNAPLSRSKQRIKSLSENRCNQHPLPSVDFKPDRRTASAVLPFLILRKDASFPKLKELYEDPQKWLEEVGENADLYRLKVELFKVDGRWVTKQALVERFTGVSFEE